VGVPASAAVEPASLDTTAEPCSIGIGTVRRGHRLRSIFFVLLIAFLVAAVLGVFGYRSRTVAAQRGDFTLTVTYAQFTRRGVTAPVQIEIDATNGFSDDVTVAIDSSYLNRLDVHNVTPQPDSETTNGDTVFWTFTKPDGNSLSIDVDAQIEAGASPGWIDGTTVVAVGGLPIANASYRTWIWP
jgi:hypothetical protein